MPLEMGTKLKQYKIQTNGLGQLQREFSLQNKDLKQQSTLQKKDDDCFYRFTVTFIQ